jgi:hypothetical protein
MAEVYIVEVGGVIMERLTDKVRNFDGTASAKESLIDEKYHYPSDYCSKILTKLADFEDKQEQGLLIELKLKPGDKFYMIQCGFVVPHIIVRIDISEDGIEYDAFGVSFTEDEIGKTIFLTEAEAEEALAKMGE